MIGGAWFTCTILCTVLCFHGHSPYTVTLVILSYLHLNWVKLITLHLSSSHKQFTGGKNSTRRIPHFAGSSPHTLHVAVSGSYLNSSFPIPFCPTSSRAKSVWPHTGGVSSSFHVWPAVMWWIAFNINVGRWVENTWGWPSLQKYDEIYQLGNGTYCMCGKTADAHEQ